MFYGFVKEDLFTRNVQVDFGTWGWKLWHFDCHLCLSGSARLGNWLVLLLPAAFEPSFDSYHIGTPYHMGLLKVVYLGSPLYLSLSGRFVSTERLSCLRRCWYTKKYVQVLQSQRIANAWDVVPNKTTDSIWMELPTLCHSFHSQNWVLFPENIKFLHQDFTG